MKTLLGMVVSVCCVTASSGSILENFDSYAAGSSLHGQGGWTGWLGDSRAGGIVSDLYSLSPGNSLFVNNSSTDVVLPIVGVSSGSWRLSFWQYIENSDARSYIGLLNEYPPVANPGSYNVAIEIDLWANRISEYFRGGSAVAIEHRWVEHRFDIDFSANVFSWFYDGTLLQSGIWHRDGRQPALAGLEMWGSGARVYYDNIELVAVPEPQAAIMLGVGLVWAIRSRGRARICSER